MKTVAKKPHQDNAHKKRHDTVHSPLKNAHSINSDHQTSIIQLKPICPCDGGCPRCAPVIQPKLTIGQPNDKYEQEADRVADQVMRMPEPNIHRKAESSTCRYLDEEEQIQTKPIADQITPLLHRQVETKIDEKEEEPAQLKALPNKSLPVTTSLQNQIQSLKGGGQPLSAATRAFFEPRFGRNFSSVRVHTDLRAEGIARSLKARAFTVGNDMIFGAKQYVQNTDKGRWLIAHELTHTLQQLAGRNVSHEIQCLGDLSEIPPDMPCIVPPASPSSFTSSYEFRRGNSTLNATQKSNIESFVASWHAQGGNSDVRVDGYASKRGPDPLNWRLSCNRALAVKAELMNPSSRATPGIPESRINIFAHGETDEFSTAGEGSDRRVTLRTPIRPPTPTPPEHPPEVRICGPYVSTEVTGVWSRIQSDFNSWGFSQKEAACRHLIQPIIRRRGGFEINKDAFDTLGLYQGSAGWLRRPPYHPPCAVPGTCAPGSSDPFDPCHEDPNTCSNTVKVGSDCWLSGTPNYGTYGIMMRLCWDWTLPLILLPPWNIYHEAFSLPSTILIVEAYKRLQGDDPLPPRRWAVATWLRGPGARVSGGNRPRCSPTCTVSYPNRTATGFGRRFDYVWEPVRRR